jgi:hypothetical protein
MLGFRKVEDKTQMNDHSEEFAKIFENEKKAVLRREAEDFIALEKSRLSDISEAQLQGIVNFTSREIPDNTICEACLVTKEQLLEIRKSSNYKALLQIAQANKLGKHLNIDEKLDRLEDLSVSRLIDEVQTKGNVLETMELLAIGKFSNAARRKLSSPNGSAYNRPGEGIPINVNSSEIININISSIVLDRLKAVSESSTSVIDFQAIEDQYSISDEKPLDVKKVSEILSVDLSRNTARVPTVAETYHDQFEENQSIHYSNEEG